MTVIGSCSIQCVGPGPGYSGPLTDNNAMQGNAGQIMVANGNGSWSWGGGVNFFAPDCDSGANSAYAANSLFLGNCATIMDNGGSCIFGPNCYGINTSCGYAFFGPNCSGINEDGGFHFL